MNRGLARSGELIGFLSVCIGSSRELVITHEDIAGG